MTLVSSTKGERTRARILEEAVRLFGDRGYRSTSVAAVARAAGLTPAAVFAYWPSKEALFTAAVDADAMVVLDELSAALDDDIIGFEPSAAVRALFQILTDHGLARRVLAGREPDVIDRVLELAAFDRIRDQIARSIRSGQDAGRVRRDLDPELAAIGVETLVVTLTMGLLQLRTAPQPPRIEGVNELIRAALRPEAEG